MSTPDPVRAALAELVELKSIKDLLRSFDESKSSFGSESAKRSYEQHRIDMQSEYSRRKPLAWAAARAALSAQPPSVWQLVPVEPTPEMLYAARSADKEYQARMGVDDTVSVGAYDHWCAMLAAAPKPEGTK